MVKKELSFEEIINTIGKNDLFERTDTQGQMYFTKDCDLFINITRDKNNNVVYAFCKKDQTFKNFTYKRAAEISDSCNEKYLLNLRTQARIKSVNKIKTSDKIK